MLLDPLLDCALGNRDCGVGGAYVDAAGESDIGELGIRGFERSEAMKDEMEREGLTSLSLFFFIHSLFPHHSLLSEILARLWSHLRNTSPLPPAAKAPGPTPPAPSTPTPPLLPLPLSTPGSGIGSITKY